MNGDFSLRLLEHITSIGQLGEAERHLLSAENAKHIRPAFLFACADMLEVPKEKQMNFASAVELIHTATLLHDDIIDEATERRHLPSVNAQYGNKMAVLAGDGLLALALSLLADDEKPAVTVKKASETVMLMAEAVAMEFEFQDDTAPTEEKLLQIVDGKTGTLFSLCGFLAGTAANETNAAEALGRVGMLMGRIFQIRDDIKDIDEDRDNSIPTLPLVFGIDYSEACIVQARTELDEIVKNFNNYPHYQQFIDTVYGGIR
jgi:geranylgeranyl pyrophosphate synthase